MKRLAYDKLIISGVPKLSIHKYCNIHNKSLLISRLFKRIILATKYISKKECSKIECNYIHTFPHGSIPYIIHTCIR